MTTPDLPRLSLTVVLSGGASLGAYQAGALSALVDAVGHLRDRDPDLVRLEGVGGASAGAIVGLLGAHALLTGRDATDLLHSAWVDRVDLGLLLGDDGRSPLAMDDLETGFRDLLVDADPAPGHRQDEPIGVHVALTGLRGLTYPIRGLVPDRAVAASTYTDWARFVLTPGHDPASLFDPSGRSPVDLVLASAANPGGFAPRLIDRADDADAYADRGIRDFPDSGALWYTDGGLLQSEPIGRVLAAAGLAHPRDPDRRHATVLVDPRSEGPSAANRWADPDDAPGWAEGLARALSIVPTQILYDDARRVADANERLARAERLVDVLVDHLPDHARSDLAELVYDGEGDIDTLVGRAVRDVAGLTGKHHVDVDVISPLALVDGDDDVADLLAGEFLGDFGGFLDRDLRASDFALGRAAAADWLPDALTHAGFPDDLAADVARAVAESSPDGWRDTNAGDVGAGDLPWTSRARLGRLAGRYLRVLATETADGAFDGVGEAVGTVRRRLAALAGRD